MAPPRPLHVTARSTPTTTTARMSAYSTNVWPCSLRTRVSRRSTRDIRNLPVTRFGALHPLARRCSRRRAPAERTKGRTELDHQTSLPALSRRSGGRRARQLPDGVDRRLDRIAQSAPRGRKQTRTTTTAIINAYSTTSEPRWPRGCSDSYGNGVHRRLHDAREAGPCHSKQNAHDDGGQDQGVLDERLSALLDGTGAPCLKPGHVGLLVVDSGSRPFAPKDVVGEAPLLNRRTTRPS